MSFKTINPANENVLKDYRVHSLTEVSGFLARAQQFYSPWSRQSLSDRSRAVSKLEDVLAAEREPLAIQMSLEMGKPITQSLSEIDKSIASSKYIRENMARWISAREENVGGGFSVHLRPMGVILGIMPWNFPLWQVIRFAVPALLCGNTILLKHAPNTWGVAEMIDEIFKKSFLSGAYQNLRIDLDAVPALIAHPDVRGVSLTGSRRAGSKVGALAGEHLKKCVLELGGSDAYVILDDADVAKAVEVCARARLQNAGQSCVAAKRFIVTPKRASDFTEGLLEEMKKTVVGDPMLPDTKLGPMARRDLREELHKQVETSVLKGAKKILGGEMPSEKGYFYPASVLTGVEPGQPAFDEELFGPVASVITARDEKEAFQLANRSIYGLGGAVFSSDVERARKLALEELEAGMVFINEMVKSDASVPFGGIKDSGLGRELGREGSLEFMNVKTLYSQKS